MDLKVLRDEEKKLRQELSKLTWAGKLWGRNGAIRWSRKRYKILEELGREAEALSALSSTYYTAAGQALARGEGLRVLWWLPVAIWCLMRANLLSDRLERLLGLSRMSSEELDCRARITFKAWRYKKALACTREALSRQDLAPDTRALLLMGLAEILEALNKSGQMSSEVERIYNEIVSLCTHLKPTTEVRIMKSYGEYLLNWDYPVEAEGILVQAIDVAREHKLGDQEIKIAPILAEAQRRARAGQLKN
jgi:tetratricopeptide (TPR) repeat protein